MSTNVNFCVVPARMAAAHRVACSCQLAATSDAGSEEEEADAASPHQRPEGRKKRLPGCRACCHTLKFLNFRI
jgi:hypothetical protein